MAQDGKNQKEPRKYHALRRESYKIGEDKVVRILQRGERHTKRESQRPSEGSP